MIYDYDYHYHYINFNIFNYIINIFIIEYFLFTYYSLYNIYTMGKFLRYKSPLNALIKTPPWKVFNKIFRIKENQKLKPPLDPTPIYGSFDI